MSLLTNLGAYYKFDESSGNAADSSGNSRTLTNNGSVTYQAGKINNGAGAYSSSKWFDGGTGFAGFQPGDAFSIAGWIYFNSTGSFHVMLGRTTAGGVGWRISTEAPGGNMTRIRFTGSDGTNDYTDDADSLTLNTGTWYHLAITTSSFGTHSATHMYLNGSEVTLTDRSTAPMSTISYTSVPVQLGAYGSSHNQKPFDGYNDELGLWTRALTSGEVTTLYNSGNGNSYPFGSSYSQTLTDSVTNTDVLIRAVTRNITETITNTATALKATTRNITEAITNTDVFAFLKTKGALFVETITNTDTIVKDITRNISETVTNTATALKGATRNLLDTITNTDTFSRVIVFGRVLTETITNTDVVTFILNGIGTLWRKRTKPSDPTWTARTKPTTTWTPRTKPSGGQS